MHLSMNSMYIVLLLTLLSLGYGQCWLWPKGIVHYSINAKDYDIHSQEEIVQVFSQIEREICVKFFNTPLNYSGVKENKVLFVTNPTKRKDCHPDYYDYSGDVIEFRVGYRCINEKDISRAVVDMLRASIDHSVSAINSNDLVRRFQEKDMSSLHVSVLSPTDRNFINANYHEECSALTSLPAASRRAGDADAPAGAPRLAGAALRFYTDKLWPFGIVIYDVEEGLRGSPDHVILKAAMTAIELVSCLVFQFYDVPNGMLTPKSMLWFGSTGEDTPKLGFSAGNQTLNLHSITHGAPGHKAHALNNLMRTLGVPMMSNRFDRDHYVKVNWRMVTKGKEHLLERTPSDAWVRGFPYDFNSATHAPTNYLCDSCQLGAQTVSPLHDRLWERQSAMGHQTNLSEADIKLLGLLYGKECSDRSS